MTLEYLTQCLIVFNLYDDETNKQFKYEEYFKNRGDKLWE